MRIADHIKRATDELRTAGVEDPQVEAALLLGAVLGRGRTSLLLAGAEEVAPGAALRFREMLGRRLRRQPLAHILGEQEFWSLSFTVTPDVLIPRPETEILLERALAVVRRNWSGKALRVLDLGTGSGIIAVVSALELPTAQVWAVDVSPAALEVARCNAARHGVAERLHFIQSDWLAGLPAGAGFDLVLSNPPYVEAHLVAGKSGPDGCRLEPEVVEHEPHLALDGGADGLRVYARFATELPRVLRPGGLLFLEIGAGQGQAVMKKFQSTGMFGDCVVHPDYAGHDRVFQARRIPTN